MSIDEAPHVTLSGDRSGEYIVVEEREDGALVLAPGLSVTAILRRQEMESATLEEFEAEYGSVQPADGEG
jgi:hypothetical protein